MGNRIGVERVNPEYDDSPNDTGGVDDTLRPMEATDADDVRNDDGDQVVDPPDDWAAADHIADEPEGESLDEKLAAERPEKRPEQRPVAPNEGTADVSGETELRTDDEIDRIDPDRHGRDEGDVDDTPEDGDSIFPVVE